MKLLKSSLIIFSSMGLFFLTACDSGNQSSNSNTSPAASSPESTKSAAVTPTTETNQSSEPASSVSETAKTESLGGQVAEIGTYHLEFVPEKESNGTHLDFYLQKSDTHEAVTNAKVIAQVQSPDGKQQSLNLTYDAEGKHYTTLFPGTTTGQYQVKITADASGENVNGRFSFQQ